MCCCCLCEVLILPSIYGGRVHGRRNGVSGENLEEDEKSRTAVYLHWFSVKAMLLIELKICRHRIIRSE